MELKEVLNKLEKVHRLQLPPNILEECVNLRRDLESLLENQPLRELNPPATPATGTRVRAKRGTPKDDPVKAEDAKKPSKDQKTSIQKIEKPPSPKRSRRFKSPIVNPAPTPKAQSVKRESVENVPAKMITPQKQKMPIVSQASKKEIRKKSTDKELKVVINKLKNETITQTLNVSLSSSFSKAQKNISKQRNHKGETPLHSACFSSKFDKVRDLLAEKANPNTKDNAGWTPIHEIVSNGALDILKILLENGALPSVPGLMNETPLHEAVRNKSTEAIKLLIQFGADINSRNSKGVTPYDLASDEIKKLLTKGPSDYKIEEKFPSFLSLFNDKLTSNVKIYPVSLSNDNIKSLNTLSAHHSNLFVQNKIESDTTFVLLESPDDDVCQMITDTISAVLLGIPIINAKWLNKCTSTHLTPLNEYKMTSMGGYRDCIRLSYLNRLKLFPSLFNGCHFFFRGFKKKYEISSSLSVNRDVLTKFVVEGGGIVLKREPNPESIPPREEIIPFHALKDTPLENCSHFIVYGDKPELTYNMKHIKSLPVIWMLESIQNFILADP